jgi:TolB-like protein/DNA-binding winged helix-turn-helix (wHTH) protein
MDSRITTAAPFRLLDWRIDPARGLLSPAQGGEPLRLDARSFQLLLCLAARPGVVVSIDELLDEVWTGVVVSPDSVYQAVAGLRRALGDDTREPRYIATVPRQGYRLVATPLPDAELPPAPTAKEPPAPAPSPHRSRRRLVAGLGGAVVVIAAALALVKPWQGAEADARSVAVMPFLDLTDAMDQEPFADGMTEQLIDTLSHRPGWKIPAFSRVLSYKGKEVAMAQLGRELHVRHLLEGSVRRSENTLRVSARLVRVADGYVVWSSTYDRPASDRLGVQAEVAGEVGKALDQALTATLSK